MNTSSEQKTEISRLRDEIKRGTRVVSLDGLTSIASKAFVLSQIQADAKKTLVVVADTNTELETWNCDLEFWNGKWKMENGKSEDSKDQKPTTKNQILTLPSFETDVYSGVSPHAETQEERALTLWRLAQNAPDFLVVSAKSLITKTLTPADVKNLGAELKLDADYAPEMLIENLVAVGYVREEPIKNVGEFSVRGGILDVWSPTAENPVRIEFFGDTVDSIREFDAETQLSIGQLKQISIAPMREFAARSQDFNDWTFFAEERFADEKYARNLKDRTAFSGEGESFSGWEFLLPLIRPHTSSVFDFLKDAVLIIDEPALIEQTLGAFYETIENRHAEITELGDVGLEPQELFLQVEELREKLDGKQRVELRALGKTAAATDEQFQLTS